MKHVWVILNETKDAVVSVFETDEADSKPHWPEFLKHRAGCVFCGKIVDRITMKGTTQRREWYYNYFYWNDQSRWGYSDPDGIGWAAIMVLPEPIKLLVMIGDT